MNPGTFISTGRFVFAVVVLGAGAAVMQVAKTTGWLVLIKDELPIRKPLDEFDSARLRPYTLTQSDLLPADLVHELGTTEYLNWRIEVKAPEIPAAGKVYLSVTYYTDVKDRVPHVPEECLHVAGYSIESDDLMGFAVLDEGPAIVVRRQMHKPPPRQSGAGARGSRLVYYTFRVNSVFKASRDSVRMKFLDRDETHLYYSKVELTFEGVKREDVPILDGVAECLLKSVLGELIASHWPRPGWERGGPPAAGA